MIQTLTKKNTTIFRYKTAMFSLLDGNRTRNTPTEIIVLLYFRNSYEVRFLFWFIDRQRNERTCYTGLFSELKTP